MWLAPRVDRLLGARAMQAAALCLAFAWLWPGLISVPALFFAAMVVVGMSSGLLDVIMNARVSELEATHSRSLMNANHAMFSLAYAVSALITGVTREIGLPPTVVMAGWGLFTLAVLPMLRMDVTVVEVPASGRGRYPLWPILLCGAIVLVAFMSEATVEAWSALHVERTLGGGAAEGALGPAMLGLTMMVGRFSGQVLAERVREVTVVVWASLMASTGAVIAATAATPLMAYVGFGTLGLGVSVIGPMGLALVGRIVPPHMRTEAISRAAVIGFSGFFVAPSLMGFVSHGFGLRVAFGCVAVLLLTAIPLALTMSRMERAKAAANAA
jgi:MFS family permease